MVIQGLSGGFVRRLPPEERAERALADYRDGLEALVKEREDLILARDRLLFDPASPVVTSRKQREADAKIRAKEKEIALYQKKGATVPARSAKVQASSADGENDVRVTLWESGKKLSALKPGATAREIKDSGADGFLWGSLEDVAGYLVVSMGIATGFGGDTPVEAVAAGPYEDLDLIVASLVASVRTTLSYLEPVTLRFETSPPEASVYVDGSRLPPGTDRLVVPSGAHDIVASAEGFAPPAKSGDFSGSPAFLVSVTLERETATAIAFSTSVTGSLVYLETRYIGEAPVETAIPPRITLGQAVTGDVPTWFYIDPSEGAESWAVETETVKTKTRIDTQRSILYWSLGALYISLPASMFTYAVFQDKLRAYNAGYLPYEQATVDDINGWMRASQATQALSIGLGINYAIQLARYFLAAERALPKKARPGRQ